jgi:hypothetical protein
MVHRIGWVVLASAIGWAAPAAAQVTTDQPASIVVFPKVVVDASRDTVIQLSNTANATVGVRCWYVDARLLFPELPPGPSNPPQWIVTDFELVLTRQQPTVWVGSRGRPIDALDEPCAVRPPDYDCYGAGFDPGRVPALSDGFAGELRCVETDPSGAPISGNHLIGEATLEDRNSGDVSKYSALGFAGLDANDGDDELRLGEEYVGCPDSLLLDHTTDGSEVVAVGAGSSVATQLTLLPCAANLDTLDPETIIVLFSITTELETRFSAALSLQCWRNAELGDINPVFAAPLLGVPTAQTRIRAAVQSGPGVLAVAEETRRVADDNPTAARAAANIHVDGIRSAVDVITLP